MKVLPPYPLKLQAKLFAYAIGLILSLCTVIFAGFFIFLGKVILYKFFAFAWLIAGCFVLYRMVLALGSGNQSFFRFEFDAFLASGDYETWTVPAKTAEVLKPYFEQILARQLKVNRNIAWVAIVLGIGIGLGLSLVNGQWNFLGSGIPLCLVGILASIFGPRIILNGSLNRLKSNEIYVNEHIWAWGGVATEIKSTNNRIEEAKRIVIPELDNWILYAVLTSRIRGRSIEYRWGFVLISPEQAEAWAKQWHKFLKIKD